MKRYLSSSEMRKCDDYTINTLGVKSEELMLRAGEALAQETEKILHGGTVCIVCGVGNNGGDGYVAARILFGRGYAVKVYALQGKLSLDCAREKQRYGGAYAQTIGGDVIVDCIFGTGLNRAPSGEFEEAIKAINAAEAFVVSADIPSGLNGDNGLALGEAVKADLTVAIGEYKLGFLLGDGKDYCGKVIKKDIGIVADGGAYEAEEDDIKKFFPARKNNSHKGTYGAAQLVVGSDKYTGAAVLCAEAALRSGCGYVKLLTSPQVKNAMVTAFPQIIFTEEADLSANATCIGCGSGKSKELYDYICNIVKNYKGKLILDADALNSIAEYGDEPLNEAECEILVTPHIKEFSRLTKLSVDEILNDPVGHARNYAKKHKITVLLKGASSVISDGDKTFINSRGNTALAKGGSGDMLTGLICGSSARGLNLFDSAVASAFVLGAAAEDATLKMPDYCVTAKEILNAVPQLVKRLTT